MLDINNTALSDSDTNRKYIKTRKTESMVPKMVLAAVQ